MNCRTGHAARFFGLLPPLDPASTPSPLLEDGRSHQGLPLAMHKLRLPQVALSVPVSCTVRMLVPSWGGGAVVLWECSQGPDTWGNPVRGPLPVLPALSLQDTHTHPQCAHTHTHTSVVTKGGPIVWPLPQPGGGGWEREATLPAGR